MMHSLGSVVVNAVNNRGFTPEEIAERALSKIIYVGKDIHPLIQEQAEAYKDSIRTILVFYMHEAIKSNKTTLANKLCVLGHPELVQLL